MSGYRVGPTLAPGEAPWPVGWEQDPRIDDGHAHDWETVLIGASGSSPSPPTPQASA